MRTVASIVMFLLGGAIMMAATPSSTPTTSQPTTRTTGKPIQGLKGLLAEYPKNQIPNHEDARGDLRYALMTKSLNAHVHEEIVFQGKMQPPRPDGDSFTARITDQSTQGSTGLWGYAECSFSKDEIPAAMEMRGQSMVKVIGTIQSVTITDLVVSVRMSNCHFISQTATTSGGPAKPVR